MFVFTFYKGIIIKRDIYTKTMVEKILLCPVTIIQWKDLLIQTTHFRWFAKIIIIYILTLASKKGIKIHESLYENGNSHWHKL